MPADVSENELDATLLADLLENSPVGLHIQDEQGIVVRANATLLQMLGCALSSVCGKSFSTFYANSADARIVVERLARGETVLNHETSLVAADGSIRLVIMSANVLSREGRFVYARCFTRDVTDIHQARRRLADTAARYRATLDAALDAILTMDSSGQLVDMNSAAEQIFGYSRKQALKRPLAELIIPPRLRAKHFEGLQSYLRTGVARVLGKRIESSALHADGHEFPVELSISVAQTDPPLFAATVRDISQRVRKEQELQGALEALRAGDRGKDEFIAMLGHELRNPLAPVRNAANLLRYPGLPPEKTSWAASVIERNITHMARLLDDLLDVARVKQGKLEVHKSRVLLAEVVAFAIELATHALDAKDHRLELQQVLDATVTLVADAQRLSQVIANLLVNAAKYSESGRLVVLATEVEDDWIRVSVTDQGVGFDKGDVASMFAMFEQLESGRKTAEGGLGVGLALAKGIVELHGGTICAHSEGHGRGSKFTVTLPRH